MPHLRAVAERRSVIVQACQKHGGSGDWCLGVAWAGRGRLGRRLVDDCLTCRLVRLTTSVRVARKIGKGGWRVISLTTGVWLRRMAGLISVFVSRLRDTWRWIRECGEGSGVVVGPIIFLLIMVLVITLGTTLPYYEDGEALVPVFTDSMRALVVLPFRSGDDALTEAMQCSEVIRPQDQ